jgi:hypothetical protein
VNINFVNTKSIGTYLPFSKMTNLQKTAPDG